MNDRPVSLFVPCIIDAVYPEVGEAAAAVFQRLGIPVTVPTGQTCCGQPAYNAGYRKEAKRAAAHFLSVFQRRGDIVCPSGSCVHMIRHHYPSLFQEDKETRTRAESVAGRTYELTEYLVDVLGADDLGASFDGAVTIHDSCHLLHGLGVHRQLRKLVANVKGARLVEMRDADRCCGFGGAFSVKYPDISGAILTDKVDNIEATGADAVVGGDMGCLMNIEGMLKRRNSSIRVLHIAQLIAGGPAPAKPGYRNTRSG